jgi:hypothetical protein
LSIKAFEKLPKNEQKQIVDQMHAYQKGLCYICEEHIDLTQPVDVDHIRSKDQGGIDDSRNNWGLTHAHCNRAKSNRDLDLQRYLTRFQRARRGHLASGQSEDMFTVGVALSIHGGAKRETAARVERDTEGNEHLIITWEVGGQITTSRVPIQVDQNNPSVKSITAMVPIEQLFHDSDINPRSIVDLEPFIEEFYRGHPQLLPSLAHLTLDGNDAGRARIMLFDGQHKAAAQVFLGNRVLYLRVFLNADLKLLKSTNYGAHTKLAQIHFPMAIQDKVGHDIFRPAQEDYLNQHEDRSTLRESSFFKALTKEERAEMRGHFQGYLKFRVVSAADVEGGKFFEYVETVSARSKTKPLAYETVRKAIFNNFLYLHETDVPIKLALEMRDRERDNLVALLRLFTQKVLSGSFDLSKGIYKIEEKLSTDPSIRDSHLRAYRLCRQAPLIVVMRELRNAMAQLLSLRGKYKDPAWLKEQVLWADIDDKDWAAVGKMLNAIISHKVWIERNELNIRYLQDTRQGSWEDILIRGTLPDATEPVYEPLNQATLLKYASDVIK